MRKAVLGLVMMLFVSSSALADGNGSKTYAVTITNITSGQTFTPLLVATHKSSVSLFELGVPASIELATIAESGNIEPMATLLNGMHGKVYATANSEGLLGPGESVTVEIESRRGFDRVSVVGMLIPTNDTFVALDSAYLSRWERQHVVPAYDAGSEHNDELCENIPGPVCGGAALSMEDGEGFVHISGGINGIGDLEPASYDWKNPVAQISVRQAH